MFKPGDKVYEYGDRYTIYTVVSGPCKNGFIDLIDNDGDTIEYHIDDINLLDPIADEQMVKDVTAKLKEAKDAFAAAFELWSQAEEIANARNFSLQELKHNDLVDFSEIEDVANAGGWSTSSMYC